MLREGRCTFCHDAEPPPSPAAAEVGGERVFVLRTHLDAAEGGTLVEYGDRPIWVLETAPAPVVRGA